MAQITEDDQDSKLNPGQQHADSRFGSHDKIEGYDRSNDGFDDIVGSSKSPSSQTANILTGLETNPSNTYTGDNSGGLLKGEQNSHISNYVADATKDVVTGKKPKGPIGWIIGILVGGGITMSMLASPGLLLVHMKETMFDRFNTQLTAIDRRTNAVIRGKLNSLTQGFCAGSISIKCKYSTMSDPQIEKLKSVGIEVETDGKTILGRHKPVNFLMTDGDNTTKIPASEYANARRTNPEFNRRLYNAYNPKSISISGKGWDWLKGKLKFSKNPKIEGTTDKERAKSLNDSTKNGIPDDGTRVKAGDIKDKKTGEVYTEEEANKMNGVVKELVEEADDTTKKALTQVADKAAVEDLAKTGAKGLFNGLKITGIADTVCQAYNAVRMLGYAAKSVRAVQLARYALIFLATADAIKAGKATPEQVAYLGGILTTLAVDAAGAARGSATDSYGYRFSAFGDVGTQSSFTSRFLAGGGLTGGLITFTSTINNSLGGSPRTTCKVLGNPFVGVGSAAVGIVAAVFTGGISLTANEIAVAAVSVVLSVGMMLIPTLLKDIVAGKVTENLVGEDAGDAITSGSGALMGSTANAGGSSILRYADAIAYNELQQQTLAELNKNEASKLSPFDPTSKYTFLGSIVSKLIPATSSISSISSGFSSILSFVGSSFKSILPTTSAISSEQYKASLEICQDIDYKDMGIATDPFCNPVFGIPPKYLDKDPLTIVNELSGQIDDQTGEPVSGSDYDKFVNECMQREDSYDPETGSQCIIDDNNANYYLHYIDQRILVEMDGEEATAPSSISSTTVTDDYSSNDSNSITLYSDSSNVACASGTIDNGIKDGYNNGKKVSIKTCKIPGTYDTSTGTMAIVNSRASNQFLRLTQALKAYKGVSTLSVNASFRTYSTQASLYARYGSKRAARPGYSNHQMGLAIDFQLSTTSTRSDGSFDATKPRGKDAVYDWLTDNARKYGIEKIPNEAWHWQTVGLQ